MKEIKKGETIGLNKNEIHAVRALIALNQKILEQAIDHGVIDIQAEIGLMEKLLSQIGQLKLHIKLGIVEGE